MNNQLYHFPKIIASSIVPFFSIKVSWAMDTTPHPWLPNIRKPIFNSKVFLLLPWVLKPMQTFDRVQDSHEEQKF